MKLAFFGHWLMIKKKLSQAFCQADDQKEIDPSILVALWRD
jgi:hypothetical protein